MKKHNVAIVGAGSMGVELLFDKTIPFVYSFAGAVFKNPRTKLVALVDIDKQKLMNISHRLKTEGYPSGHNNYTTLEKAVLGQQKKGERVDVVCCAAGPKVNADVIRSAEKFGIRGVYCEKPLTLSLAEADELASIEAKTGLKAQVNYLRNFETFHLAVLDFIRKGGIGDVLIARNLYKGGALAVSPHGIALLNLLFGKPLSVSACYSPLSNTRCVEDPNVDGTIRYHFEAQDRDVNVSIMATGRGELQNNTYIFEFEFTGTKGRISILENGFRVRYERMEPSRTFESLGEIMPYDTACIPAALKADTPREFVLDGLEQLLNAIETGRATNCSLKMARDAEEVAHALVVSAKNNGRIEWLPLADRSHTFLNAVAGVKILKQETGMADKTVTPKQ